MGLNPRNRKLSYFQSRLGSFCSKEESELEVSQIPDLDEDVWPDLTSTTRAANCVHLLVVIDT